VVFGSTDNRIRCTPLSPLAGVELPILRWIGLAFFISCCACGSLFALDPNRLTTQYAHTSWRVQDGIFTAQPTAIAQTSDGYLWIGTENGLVRFDGVRFVSWASSDGQQFTKPVYSLLPDKNGSLWIGTATSLANLNRSVVKTYDAAPGRVNAIVQDIRGNIWFARSRVRDANGPLCKVVAQSVQCFGKADGIPFPYAGALVEDSVGYLWVGGVSSIVRWKPGSSTTFAVPVGKSNEGLSGTTAFATGVNGELWVGLSRKGPRLGLQRLVDTGWKSLRIGEFDGTGLSITSLYRDRHDSLWVGTENQGIYRIRSNDVDHYTSIDGLSSDSINSFCEDREGNLWVATARGIDSFRDLSVVTISPREGLVGNRPGSVLASRDGTLWIGNHEALDYVRQGQLGSIQPKDGLPGQRVTSLFEDRQGGLWVGTDRGLFVYREGRFIPIRPLGTSAMGPVLSLTQDRDGRIWATVIGTERKLICIQGGRVVTEFRAPQTLTGGSLAADPAGGIWISSYDGVLAHFREGRLQEYGFDDGRKPGAAQQLLANPDGTLLGATPSGVIGWRLGKMQILNVRNGLPCNSVYGLTFDDRGGLWLYAQCGLVGIPAQDLKSWWENAEATVHVTVLDRLDGAQTSAANFRPSAARTLDGRLWFVNGTVLQVFAPGQLVRNPQPPPVHIEGIVADRNNYWPGDKLRLPPLVHDIEIDYTALSFVAPSKVLFRYKLEGYDTQWHDPGTRRAAYYNHLRPGQYTFRVIASNNSGLWNTDGASLEFNIAPAYYQTNWFRALCGFALLALLWALYQFRLRQLRRQFNIGLEARVNERTRIARELHDTLLQSLHGLMFQFQAARNLLPRSPENAMRALDEAIAGTEQAIVESRDAIHDIRSQAVAEADLPRLLETEAKKLTALQDAAAATSTTFRVILEGAPRPLSPHIRDEVCRIAQELMRNAFQHSGARQIEAEIRYDKDQLRLRLSDDGKGIDPIDLEQSSRPGHWGLPGVRERAQSIESRLTFWSQAGVGTEVELTVPAATAYERISDGSRFRPFHKDKAS